MKKLHNWIVMMVVELQIYLKPLTYTGEFYGMQIYLCKTIENIEHGLAWNSVVECLHSMHKFLGSFPAPEYWMWLSWASPTYQINPPNHK